MVYGHMSWLKISVPIWHRLRLQSCQSPRMILNIFFNDRLTAWTYAFCILFYLSSTFFTHRFCLSYKPEIILTRSVPTCVHTSTHVLPSPSWGRLIFQERDVVTKCTPLGECLIYTDESYKKYHQGKDPSQDNLKLEDIEMPNGSTIRGVKASRLALTGNWGRKMIQYDDMMDGTWYVGWISISRYQHTSHSHTYSHTICLLDTVKYVFVVYRCKLYWLFSGWKHAGVGR